MQRVGDGMLTLLEFVLACRFSAHLKGKTVEEKVFYLLLLVGHKDRDIIYGNDIPVGGEITNVNVLGTIPML